VWARQIGTSGFDSSAGVSADGLGNVFITGATQGNLGATNAGGSDVFVSKYNAAGNLLWSRQLGSADDDYGNDASADGHGNVYITGETYGSLAGPNAGGIDVFVSKFDSAGTLLWKRQIGSDNHDDALGVSADGLGNVYSSGQTAGSLGGPNSGSYDVFIAKLVDPVPEPATFALAAICFFGAASGINLRQRTERNLTPSTTTPVLFIFLPANAVVDRAESR
jgi:hypothetical protein